MHQFKTHGFGCTLHHFTPKFRNLRMFCGFLIRLTCSCLSQNKDLYGDATWLPSISSPNSYLHLTPFLSQMITPYITLYFTHYRLAHLTSRLFHVSLSIASRQTSYGRTLYATSVVVWRNGSALVSINEVDLCFSGDLPFFTLCLTLCLFVNGE